MVCARRGPVHDAQKAPVSAVKLIARERPFGQPVGMIDRALIRTSLCIVCSLLVLLAGCQAAAPSTKASALKPDKTQTAFFTRPAALAAARGSPTPFPLIVLLSKDPWLMVVGSDSPTFALYSDGTVLFRRANDFGVARFNPNGLKKFTEEFAGSELAQLSGQYEAADSTDQPINNLLLFIGKSPVVISIYGSLEDGNVRSRIPDPVLAALDRVRKFYVQSARPWLPREIEIMIWPYEYAPDRSIIWPKQWPSLESSTTRKRGESYSLFMPSSELPAVRSFLATRKEKGAVQIDGKKWAASIRLPFSHEDLWMGPNKEASLAK